MALFWGQQKSVVIHEYLECIAVWLGKAIDIPLKIDVTKYECCLSSWCVPLREFTVYKRVLAHDVTAAKSITSAVYHAWSMKLKSVVKQFILDYFSFSSTRALDGIGSSPSKRARRISYWKQDDLLYLKLLLCKVYNVPARGFPVQCCPGVSLAARAE